MNTLIAVMTCAAHAARRQKVRETWAANPPPGVHIKYFGGAGAPGAYESDVIQLPVPDDYAWLPHKTFWIVQFAYDNDYTRVVKVDDDTYLRLPDALSVLDKGTCVGHLRENPPHNNGIVYPQGGCYSLDRRGMAAVLAHDYFFLKPGLEDAAVGRALYRENIDPVHSGLITTDFRLGTPSPDNNIVATHHVRDELQPGIMHTIHEQLKGKPCFQV